MVLTDKDIYRHLSGKDSYGRDVVGIYPMLTDETCLFLCADSDEENFKSDVTAFRKTCEEFDIVPRYGNVRKDKRRNESLFQKGFVKMKTRCSRN